MKRLLSLALRGYFVICGVAAPLLLVAAWWLGAELLKEDGANARDVLLAESVGLYFLEEGPNARGPRFEQLVLKLDAAKRLKAISEKELLQMCGSPDEIKNLGPDANMYVYNYDAKSGAKSYTKLTCVRGVLTELRFNSR